MASVVRIQIDDRWYTVEVDDLTTDPVRAIVDGESVDVYLDRLGDEVEPSKPQPVEQDVVPPSSKTSTAPTSGSNRTFYTPMPGTIVSISVREGEQVVTGDEVCVLEAMKMQQVLRADWSGIVKSVLVQPGQQVVNGDAIVELN